MASRYYDNSDGAQRFQPGTTARADEVDAKLDQVAAGFEQAEGDIDRSLKLPASETSQELNASPLQRRRRVVGFDADGNLTLLQGFSWRGNWTAATEYFVNDVSRDPATKNIYVTVTRHTSAAALSTDITAGRVELAISVEEVEAAKTAAQTAASTATTKANEAAGSAQAASDDATQTGEDRVATGEDRTATGQDRTQTGQDRTQTGLDRTAAANSAQAAGESEAKAQQWAEAEGEVEPGKRSAMYWAAQAEEVATGNLPITSLQPGTLDTEKDYVSVDAQGALVRRNLATDVSAQLTAGNESAKLTRYDLASISTTATLDLATGNEFTVDASTARTLTFANVPTGRSMTVVLSITGASAITWPAGIRWHGDGTTAPELGATWTIVVLNYDGANWSGVLGASA